MQVSVRLAALPIPEYLDFHSGYSAPRSRIAGINSRIYCYSRIFPNERALSQLASAYLQACKKLYHSRVELAIFSTLENLTLHIR